MTEKEIDLKQKEMKKVWDEVYSKYPNIEEVLKNIYTKQLEVYNLLEELDEKYPVEGYTWEENVNDMGEDILPFYLSSKKEEKKREEEWDIQLKKQIKCVEKEHHFRYIAPGVFWCTFCGTIKKEEYSENFVNIGSELLYPEAPHFLPKFKSKK